MLCLVKFWLFVFLWTVGGEMINFGSRKITGDIQFASKKLAAWVSCRGLPQ